jgi:hypothetical protein
VDGSLIFECCSDFFWFFFEKSLKVKDLFARYKGIAMMTIWMNLAIALGIQSTSMKKYTILVDKAVHIREIVKYDTHLILT